MALLEVAKRKQFFKELGLGEYNATNIKKLQKKYMLRKSDWDGIYGQNTDNLLRHLYNVLKHANPKNFRPEEFVCECGGKYCTGYPNYMKAKQMEHLQTIRNHYNRPMIITCGLRCKKQNEIVKGIASSKHLNGKATDFYMRGVTDTLANRIKAIKYIKTLKNSAYCYGDGIDSNGGTERKEGMGNALHTDTK